METQNKNVIGRSSACYRPYSVNGKHIAEIKIYFGNEVLFTVNRGWLEHNDRSSYDILEVCGIHEVLKRNKPKFDGKHFIVKKTEQSAYKSETEYTLYICARVEKIKEFLDFETETEKHYKTAYKLFLSGVISVPDKEVYEGKWTWKQTVIPVIILNGDYRSELKPLGVEIETITKHLKAQDVDVSRYDFEKILKYYKMTLIA